MQNIKKGSLVNYIGQIEKISSDAIGLVISNPKERVFKISPGIQSLYLSVDVIFDEQIYKQIKLEDLKLICKSP